MTNTKYNSFTCFKLLLLCIVISAGIQSCDDIEIRGAEIIINATLHVIPKVQALICNEKTVSKDGPNAFDLRVHVTRAEGDNCVWVRFKCGENGIWTDEQRICVDDPAVDTGCRSGQNHPVTVQVSSVLKN